MGCERRVSRGSWHRRGQEGEGLTLLLLPGASGIRGSEDKLS